MTKKNIKNIYYNTFFMFILWNIILFLLAFNQKPDMFNYPQPIFTLMMIEFTAFAGTVISITFIKFCNGDIKP